MSFSFYLFLSSSKSTISNSSLVGAGGKDSRLCHFSLTLKYLSKNSTKGRRFERVVLHQNNTKKTIFRIKKRINDEWVMKMDKKKKRFESLVLIGYGS